MNRRKSLAHFVPQRAKRSLWLEATLWLIFLSVPLVIGLMWGTHLDDGAYAAFRCARGLATGSGLAKELVTELVTGSSVTERVGAVREIEVLFEAPLYILVL
jgi:hypothetical protein